MPEDGSHYHRVFNGNHSSDAEEVYEAVSGGGPVFYYQSNKVPGQQKEGAEEAAVGDRRVMLWSVI